MTILSLDLMSTLLAVGGPEKQEQNVGKGGKGLNGLTHVPECTQIYM